MKRLPLALVLALLVISGCGGDDDPMGPVDSPTITLTVNSMNPSDIRTPGIIEKDENISTESGNPWGRFIDSATDECGGDPAGFDVLMVSMALDVAGSQDVTQLDDVIDGTATVFFSSTRGSDASAVRVNVASGPVVGAGPVTLPLAATRASFAVLHERMVGGDFHVGVRGETSLTDNDDFSMDVRVTFSARALCQ